jgi:hypothetical protein
MTYSRSRRKLLAASAVTLGAATTAQFSYAQSSKKSFITLKIYSVTGVESQFSFKWTSLSLIETTTRQVVTLTDLNALAPHSHFAGEIDPGTYTVQGLSVPGPMVITFGLIAGAIIQSLGTSSGGLSGGELRLEAKPGEICNGGAIGFAWTFDDPVEKKGRVVSVPFPREIGAELALDGFDETRLKQLASIGIEAPKPKQTFESFPEVLEPLVKVATQYGAHTTLANGDLLLGASLGLIFKRSAANGQWTRHWSGQFDRVTMLKQIPEGPLVAASTPGTMLEWANFDNPPVLRTFGLGSRLLMQAESLGKNGYALFFRVPNSGMGVASLPMSKATLFTTASFDAVTKLNRVMELDPPAGVSSYPTLWDGETLKVYQARMGISRTSGVYTYDLATSKITETSLPTWVFAIFKRPNGHRMIRENGTSGYVGFSKDNGKTWEMGDKSMQGGFTSVAQVSETGAEYFLAMKNLRVGWSTVDVGMVLSSDGGQTWREGKTPIVNYYGGRMELLFASEREWITKTMSQGLFRSINGGENWLAWSPLNIEKS